MSTEPVDGARGEGRDALLREVRRRAARRRLRRRIGFSVASAAVVTAAALGVVGALASNHSTSVHVLGPGPTTSTTSVAPVSPPTTAPATTTTAITIPTRQPPLTTALVPVVACPTGYGVPHSPPPLPPSIRISVPAAMKDHVSIYADGGNILEVLAPSGWTCAALDAADGSAYVIAAPTAGSIPASGTTGWRLRQGDPTEAVAAGETSACFGCTQDQACPLFPAATRQLETTYGQGCPSTRPAAEKVDRISTSLVGFEDPPGVAGTATPSGGAYPADGVMTYYPSSENGSWTETCTLPPAEHDLCTVSLNRFLSLYGKN